MKKEEEKIRPILKALKEEEKNKELKELLKGVSQHFVSALSPLYEKIGSINEAVKKKPQLKAQCKKSYRLKRTCFLHV